MTEDGYVGRSSVALPRFPAIRPRQNASAIAPTPPARRDLKLARLSPPGWILGVVVALLVLPSKALYDRYQQKLGREDAELAIFRAKTLTLNKRVHDLELELRRKVPIVYRTKVVFDTLPPLIPDLLLPDAPPVPAKTLANVILIGKEAVEACHDALNTCLTVIPLKDSIIKFQQQEINILKRRVPGRWDGLMQWGIRGAFFWLGMQTR